MRHRWFLKQRLHNGSAYIKSKIFVERHWEFLTAWVCSILKTLPICISPIYSMLKLGEFLHCNWKRNLYTESFGISEQQFKNVQKRFQWYFLWIFRDSWLTVSERKYFPCRKLAIPRYAEARQFRLLHFQCNCWNCFRCLNKHLIFSERFSVINLLLRLPFRSPPLISYLHSTTSVQRAWLPFVTFWLRYSVVKLSVDVQL